MTSLIFASHALEATLGGLAAVFGALALRYRRRALATPSPADSPAEPTTPRRLTPAQMKLGVVAAVIGLGLGVYGGRASYESIVDLARTHKVPMPEWVPVGIDGGLLGVILLDLLAIWIGMPIRWLRHTARIFTAGTVLVNALAGKTEVIDPATHQRVEVYDWTAVVLHVFAPLIFLVMVEVARSLLLKRLRELDKQDGQDAGYEPLGLVCWLVRTYPSFLIWKRMRVSRLRTYAEAEDFESRRRTAYARLRLEYGRRWRRSAPPDLRYALRHVIRVEVLDRLCERAGRIVGPARNTPADARTPPGPPPRPSAGPPLSRSSRPPLGTPPGPPSNTFPREGPGIPGNPPSAINGTPPSGPPSGDLRDPLAGGGGTPPAGEPETPLVLDPDEEVRLRLEELRARYPHTIPGIKKIKEVKIGGQGVGYSAAKELQAALCAERGVEVPSETELGDRLTSANGSH